MSARRRERGYPRPPQRDPDVGVRAPRVARHSDVETFGPAARTRLDIGMSSFLRTRVSTPTP